MKSVCLAILNYNGRKHLVHLLPTAVAAARAYAGPCSVVVLDNSSTDDDVEWIRSNHPEVRCAVAPRNDFLFSYNWLLPQLSEDVVVILNNDLRVREDFIGPLLGHFSASDVFAVSASSYDWEGHERTSGPLRLTFHNGFYGWICEPQRQDICHTLFASGGFMAVDRLKFLELGGFNELYHPAYCEDLDLGFRAWRRGWRSIYEPASVVWHREQASWNLSPMARPNKLNLRHALFFQWSSLPMDRNRMRRYWTLFKLFAGGLVQPNNFWLSIYPRAWHDWRKIRSQYSGLSVSQEELTSIQNAIDSAC
jgi:N-acetylglucosaminyl-diphospho-decaprenol L-rhamnosyltransferase